MSSKFLRFFFDKKNSKKILEVSTDGEIKWFVDKKDVLNECNIIDLPLIKLFLKYDEFINKQEKK